MTTLKESGLDIPFLESNFKPSPKLAAKEGLIGILYLQDGSFGVSTYSKDFIAKNWMEFARVLSRIIESSSRLNRIDLFKATHPVIGTMTAKRNLKKIQWEEIEKETAQEILAKKIQLAQTMRLRTEKQLLEELENLDRRIKS
jgi:hypothetical protein